MKKKIINVVFLLWVISSFSVLSGQDKPAAKSSSVYSIEELREDLSFLVKSIEDIHPDIYAFISEMEFKAGYEKVFDQIKTGMSKRDFYCIAAPLVSMIRDGHTSLNLPFADMSRYTINGGKIFPIDVKCINDKIYVTANYSSNPEITVGTEILEINRIRANEIIRTLTSAMSGIKQVTRLKGASNLFSMLLWTIYKFESDYDLKFIPAGAKRTYQKRIQAMTLQEINVKKRELKKDTIQKFSYTPLLNEKIGIIEIRSFSDKNRFSTFLNNSFEDIKENGIKDLIIDMRKNGGGNSSLGDSLLNYLTDKPYNQLSKMRLKVSIRFKEMVMESVSKVKELDPESQKFLDQIKSAETGCTLDFAAEPKKPIDNGFRFNGNIYVLIGYQTYSSAILFASAIKDYKLAELIGEETGAPASHFGDILQIQLPNTGLSANISHKYFVRPSGKEGTDGVIPDHIILDKDPVMAGEDKVLDFTKNLILSKRKES